MLKKLLLAVSVAAVLLFSVFTPSAKAQTWYDQGFQEWYTKVYDKRNPSEIFGERYTAAQVQWILYSLVANLIPLPKDAGQCVFAGEVTNESCLEIIRGFIPQIGSANAAPLGKALTLSQESSPLSGIYYVKSIARRWHLIPEAQAQEGFGFRSLGPVLELWKIFRNTAYLFFILFIIATAFMIMFRVKISPQVVISVQSAIPKIAITLVLVTFSYAVAGFLIDLLYVAIGLVSLFISQANILTLNSGQIFELLTTGLPGIGGGALGIMLVYSFGFSLAVLLAVMGIGGGNAITGIGILVSLGIFLLILIGILFIALAFAIIKVLWMLLKTYAEILLLIIFSPLIISFGVISPSAGFGTWIKNLLSKIAIYPVVGVLFVLAMIFLNGAFSSLYQEGILPDNFPPPAGGIVEAFGAGGSGWNPPLTLGAGSMSIIWLLTSLIIIFIIPKTAEIIQAWIQGKPIGLGTAIGESTGLALGVGKTIGLYGAGKVIESSEKAAYHEGSPTPPVWTQVARRVLNLKK